MEVSSYPEQKGPRDGVRLLTGDTIPRVGPWGTSFDLKLTEVGVKVSTFVLFTTL